MGWDLYYRRARAIDAVLDRARRDRRYELAAQRHPEIAAVFGTTEAFLAALRYKWSLLLTGYFDQKQHEMGDVDPEKVRRIATELCTASYPTLWKLLEANTTTPDAHETPSAAAADREVENGLPLASRRDGSAQATAHDGTDVAQELLDVGDPRARDV
jgi:hypothetical protein